MTEVEKKEIADKAKKDIAPGMHMASLPDGRELGTVMIELPDRKSVV